MGAANRAQAKIDKARHDNLQWWNDNFWNKVKSLPQLKAAILIHAEAFGANGLKHYWPSNDKNKMPIPRLVIWNNFDLRYSDKVSNSHRCPHNGETNWGGKKKDVPTGYPGWLGRFEYRVEWVKKFSSAYPGSSEMWECTRIQSGTGGGGGFTLHNGSKENGLQSFGFGVELFAADWPAMANEYDKAAVWKLLNNDTRRVDEIVNEWNPVEDYK